MIRKLRKKFILINMALVTLVLLIVFGAMVFLSYRRVREESAAALHMAMTREGGRPQKFELGGPKRGAPPAPLIPVFCVFLEADGEIQKISGDAVELDDGALETALKEISASAENEGVLSALGLRYLREEKAGGIKVAFADMENERKTMTSLLAYSLLVGVGGLGAFFGISLFLSGWALRPVEKAWKQQRQFVADASHELKTPLTVILANSGILLSHPEDTVLQQQKWVVNIKEEAERMKTLVNDMLFLAKSDAAQTPVEKNSFNLSDAIWTCVLAFEPVAFEQGLSLDSEIAPGIFLTGDEGQCKQLAAILLDNACKYAGEKGTIRLRLDLFQDKIRLTVENTGDPIPAEHLEHLFERFYRADSSRCREGGGCGLGLAIAEKIVENHQGRISVVSSGETGTCFTVLLPRGA